MTHITIRETTRQNKSTRRPTASILVFIVSSTKKIGSGKRFFLRMVPYMRIVPQIRSSTLRLIALIVGRIVIIAVATFDKHPRVIVVAVITGATACSNHLYGLLRLLQLVSLACHRSPAIGIPRHHPRRRLIVTPSPLPPSDLRSSG